MRTPGSSAKLAGIMATKVMVLSDGGLASLVAAAIAAEEIVVVGKPAAASTVPASPGAPAPLAEPSSASFMATGASRIESVTVMRSRGRASTDAAQASAVAEQCRWLGVELVGRGLPPVGDDADPTRGESATIELVAAAYAALRAGCSRLIWPVQVDRAAGDREALDHAAEACDRALLVSRLLLLDAAGAPVPEVNILTPLVDLEDDQVAELALDLAIPVQSVWWWGSQVRGEQADYERQRWTTALEAVGWVSAPAIG